MYTVDDPKDRAVGFKLSEGMQVPAELASRFKFGRQKFGKRRGAGSNGSVALVSRRGLVGELPGLVDQAVRRH